VSPAGIGSTIPDRRIAPQVRLFGVSGRAAARTRGGSTNGRRSRRHYRKINHATIALAVISRTSVPQEPPPGPLRLI
jgi:hypothetical protein